MATILALIGSARAWGNCEVLAREALAGAREAGAETLALMRLTDLRVEQCTGCMVCALRGQPCPLADDMAFLLDQMARADAFLIAGPVYLVGPVAQAKRILDRLLMWSSPPEWAEVRPKPAITLTVGGLEPWRGVATAFYNTLAMSLGGGLMGWMSAYATGPGEVLLQPDALASARDLGRRLVSREPMEPPPSVCPTCGADYFHIQGERIVCPICGQEGRLVLDEGEPRIRFDADCRSERWTPSGFHHHTLDWVVPSGERFMARRQEIKALRARYDDLGETWIRPPTHGQ
ncbi:MAG: flavodoxin family protein [Anaerolineae bacterium]|nr:flavodoxin family protein [Anaerolineae bacterium]